MSADGYTEISANFPAETRFVNVARVMAASLAAETDFSIDAIEDIRLAANELVSSIVEWGVDHGASQIRLRFRLADDEISLFVEAERPDSGGADDDEAEHGGDVDELARTILGSVTDGFELSGNAGWIRKLKS